jgi:replicative superfamily II helicase
MAKFRTTTSVVGVPDTAVSLFLDLSKNTDKVEYLWGHQRDVLNIYNADCEKKQNVAIELPTGTGKTLVGLLQISAWKSEQQPLG